MKIDRRSNLVSRNSARKATLLVMALPLICVPAVAQQAQSEMKLDEIVVEGAGGSQVPPAYAGGQVATGARLGLLGNTDTKKSPFSVTSYTDQLIRDRQARTVSEALAFDPRSARPRGQAHPLIRSTSAVFRPAKGPAAK
ncbi:hypothetical protein [Bosea thiooxidans]